MKVFSPKKYVAYWKEKHWAKPDRSKPPCLVSHMFYGLRSWGYKSKGLSKKQIMRQSKKLGYEGTLEELLDEWFEEKEK